MSGWSPDHAAAYAAQRKRIVKMYVERMMTAKEIGAEISLSPQGVRRALMREGVKLRWHLGRKVRPNPFSEYSKDGKAWSSGAVDPSKKPTMNWSDQDALYAQHGDYSAHEHPDPVAGRPVDIRHRAAFVFSGSGMGCAAALCAGGNGGSVGHRR